MSAVLSPCGTWRYHLGRGVSAGIGDRTVLFVMLNPSTADAETDDPTIRRCLGFTRAWGYDRLAVVNLFAYRATDPRALVTAAEPIGPDTDGHLVRAAYDAELVVAAWGASYPPALRSRRDRVLAMLREVGPVHHLGLTKSGEPRHPLYLRGDAQPTIWEAA